MQLTVRPGWFVGLLGAVIVVLTFAHSVVYVCERTEQCGPLTSPLLAHGWLFDLGIEMNVPTWFASSQLFLCAGLLAIIAAGTRAEPARGRLYWGVLAVIFLYLSLDEATDMHGLWRTLVLPDDYRMPGTSDPNFAWIIPGAGLVIVMAVLFRRFVFSLPPRTRVYFVLAGAVYLAGVLGFEAAGGNLADESWRNTSYMVVATIEEVLEMVGILIFVYALLSHLAGQTLQVRFQGSENDAQEPATAGTLQRRAPS